MNTDAEIEETLALIYCSTKKNGECLEWTGHMDSKNLPRLWKNHKFFFVHRFIWETHNPKVSCTEKVIHTCGNYRCILVDHLQCSPRKTPINWSKVWQRMLKYTERAENGCLIWTGCTSNGYGVSSLKGKVVAAHRLSWMVANQTRDIPATIDGQKTNMRHLCHTPTCIEISHLKLGTLSENHFEDKIDNNTLTRGEKHHAASITEKNAAEIKLSKRKRGDEDYVNQRSRSLRFGVSLDLVKSIDCGKSWAFLPDRYGNTGSSRAAKAVVLRMNAKARVWTSTQFEAAAAKLFAITSKTSGNNRGDVEGDCWEFQGKYRGQYGIITMFGKSMPTHVLACEIKNGRHKRKGEVCRHLCGNPACCRPDHLSFGTPKENAVDMLTHGSKAFKMDYTKAQEIRHRRSCDHPPTQQKLAEEYGVCVGTIRSIENNYTWKQVSPATHASLP